LARNGTLDGTVVCQRCCVAGQLGRDDLSRVGVHPDMELSPGPTRPCGVLLNPPLTATAELKPGAVDQQVERFAARSRLRHRQSRRVGTSLNGRAPRDRDQAAEVSMRPVLRSGAAPGGRPPAASAPS